MSRQTVRRGMAWLPSFGRPMLFSGEVHLWRIVLEVSNEAIRSATELLTADELQRADRFRFERDRRRFALARAATRRILAQYLEIEPQGLSFEYGKTGKPDLIRALNPLGLRFNLSHSYELSLLAVTRTVPLGVDIELIDRNFFDKAIVHCFFSPDEVRCLFALPEEARAEAFFSCWTRKEAYIKALGEGLSLPLDSFSVNFGPDIPPALLRVNTNPREVNRWSVYDIEADPRYKAALVIECGDHDISCWQWVMGF